MQTDPLLLALARLALVRPVHRRQVASRALAHLALIRVLAQLAVLHLRQSFRLAHASLFFVASVCLALAYQTHYPYAALAGLRLARLQTVPKTLLWPLARLGLRDRALPVQGALQNVLLSNLAPLPTHG